jgi:hypothetical protein
MATKWNFGNVILGVMSAEQKQKEEAAQRLQAKLNFEAQMREAQATREQQKYIADREADFREQQANIAGDRWAADHTLNLLKLENDKNEAAANAEYRKEMLDIARLKEGREAKQFNRWEEAFKQQKSDRALYGTTLGALMLPEPNVEAPPPTLSEGGRNELGLKVMGMAPLMLNPWKAVSTGWDLMFGKGSSAALEHTGPTTNHPVGQGIVLNDIEARLGAIVDYAKGTGGLGQFEGNVHDLETKLGELSKLAKDEEIKRRISNNLSLIKKLTTPRRFAEQMKFNALQQEIGLQTEGKIAVEEAKRQQ